MLPEKIKQQSQQQQQSQQNGESVKDTDVVEIAEVWAYLGVLVQVSIRKAWVTNLRHVLM